MGKNVYAAPRKGPAGKRVEQKGENSFFKDQQQSRQARLQALATKYKDTINKNKGNS